MFTCRWLCFVSGPYKDSRLIPKKTIDRVGAITLYSSVAGGHKRWLDYFLQGSTERQSMFPEGAGAAHSWSACGVQDMW